MASDGLIILSFFIGILVVLLLVMLHELGHFIVAKISGAYVYEFAIGFGPRIFTWKGKETWVSIRAFPLGGFCSIASEKTDPPRDREDIEVPPERMMEYIARWKKMFFIIAGPIVNLIVAIFMFTTIFAATQVKANDMQWFGANYSSVAEKLIDKSIEDEGNKFSFEQVALMGWMISTTANDVNDENVIYSNVNDGSEHFIEGNAKLYDNPNEEVLYAKTFNDTVYFFLDHLKDLNKDEEKPAADQTVYIKFAYRVTNSRYDDMLQKGQKLRWTNYSTEEDHYTFGSNVGIAAPTRHFENSTQAYGYGWKETFTTSLSILKSLGMLVTGHIEMFSGPVGMSRQIASMMTSATTFFLYVAMLSANLFILNILTIPPLDGFKFLENIIEMIIRKEIPEKVKIWMYTIGAALFALLFLAIIIKDFIL